MAGMVSEVRNMTAERTPYGQILAEQKPVLFKGMARDWPLVREGLKSPQAAITYLKSFYQGHPVVAFTGTSDIQGRFFYTDDVLGLNFQSARVPLDTFLDQVTAHLEDSDPPSFYVGSANLERNLPGIRAENDLVFTDPTFRTNPPLVSFWVGNRTTASCHFDLSNNIAVCAAGKRRFTLFPPQHAGDLYPGPLEPTPGGQVVSMVDFRRPDFEQYPRFRQALEAAQIAEMEPGDVLVYPSMWWHHVEALAPFNILINYWWSTSADYVDTPWTTLTHALLSLRDRPQAEKDAWRTLFDYYIFGPADQAGAHLPENARGELAPLDEVKARRLRAKLLNKLNR